MRKRVNFFLRKAARSRVSLSSSDSRDPSLPSSLITTPVSSQDLYEQMEKLGLIPNEETPVFVESKSQEEIREEAKEIPIPEPSVAEAVPVLSETPSAPAPTEEPPAPVPEKKGPGRPKRANNLGLAKNK